MEKFVLAMPSEYLLLVIVIFYFVAPDKIYEDHSDFFFVKEMPK